MDLCYATNFIYTYYFILCFTYMHLQLIIYQKEFLCPKMNIALGVFYFSLVAQQK